MKDALRCYVSEATSEYAIKYLDTEPYTRQSACNHHPSMPSGIGDERGNQHAITMRPNSARSSAGRVPSVLLSYTRTRSMVDT